MKTNKEQGYYWAIYVCLNCKNENWQKVKWGTSMPVLIENAKTEYCQIDAPECDYCGCKHWSHGKRPEKC